MRIGIDAHVLGKNIGGVERYVHHLVRLLPRLCPEHDFFVFVTREALLAAKSLAGLPANVRIVPLFIADPLIQRSLVLPVLAWKLDLDAIQVQRIAPWVWGKCRILLTVHDLTPLKYASAYRGLRNTLIRLFTRSSILRADMIVTPTQTIAEEVKTSFPQCRAPVRVFYNGVDPALFGDGMADSACLATLDRLGVRRPYVFFSGAAESRKNLETAYRAISLLGEAAPTLVLAGSTRDKSYASTLEELAASLGIAGNLIRLGFVSDADLTILYRHGAAFLAPSLDEGFNMPPLEAMSCGSPVVCSDIPVHRELFEGAAQFFPANSAEDLAACIKHLMADADQRARMISAGRAVGQRYTWDAMAGRMSAFYREMLGLP